MRSVSQHLQPACRALNPQRLTHPLARGIFFGKPIPMMDDLDEILDENLFVDEVEEEFCEEEGGEERY